MRVPFIVATPVAQAPPVHAPQSDHALITQSRLAMPSHSSVLLRHLGMQKPWRPQPARSKIVAFVCAHVGALLQQRHQLSVSGSSAAFLQLTQFCAAIAHVAELPHTCRFGRWRFGWSARRRVARARDRRART